MVTHISKKTKQNKTYILFISGDGAVRLSGVRGDEGVLEVNVDGSVSAATLCLF